MAHSKNAHNSLISATHNTIPIKFIDHGTKTLPPHSHQSTRSFFLPRVEDVTTNIQNNGNPVAPVHAPDVTIDTYWAQSLTGLRIQVPDSWWPGYSDGEINSGEIVALDFAKPHEAYFQLLLYDDK